MSEQGKNEIERMGVFDNQLAIHDEDVVDMVSRGFMKGIRTRIRDAEKQLDTENKLATDMHVAFHDSIRKSAEERYTKQVKELMSGLRKSGLKGVEVAAIQSTYLGNVGPKRAEVKTDVRIIWKDGSLTHHWLRRLTAAEKKFQVREQKAKDAAAAFEKYIGQLRAHRAQVTEMASDARGAIAEHHLRKKDPNLVKKLQEVVKQDEFQLPEAPKPSS